MDIKRFTDILGITREEYRRLTLFSAVLFVFSLFLLRFNQSVPVELLVFAYSGLPLYYVYVSYVRIYSQLGYTRRDILTLMRVPLFFPLYYLLFSVFDPFCLFWVAVSSWLLEDITDIFLLYDTRRELKRKTVRTVRLLSFPLKRSEMLLLLFSSILAGFVGYLASHSILPLFFYPGLTYGLLVYSSLNYYDIEHYIKKTDYGSKATISFMFPLLSMLVFRFYERPEVRLQARQAGIRDITYTVDNARALTVIMFYLALLLTPIFYVVGLPLWFSLVLLALVPVSAFYPLLLFKLKKSIRAGRISRMFLFVQILFASLVGVGQTITRIFEYLLERVEIARMFGLEEEARIFQYYAGIASSEFEAVALYAEEVPHQEYAEMLRSVAGAFEYGGARQAREVLTEKIKEALTLEQIRMSKRVSTWTTSLTSVGVLAYAMFPFFSLLWSPSDFPLLVLLGGLAYASMLMFVPNPLAIFKNDRIYFKQRLARGAIIGALATVAYTGLVWFLFPGLVRNPLMIVLNGLVGVLVALDYAINKDLSLFWQAFNKFNDIIRLFTTNLSLFGSVEDAIREMVNNETLPLGLRIELEKIRRELEYTEPERLELRHNYWLKIFIFILQIVYSFGVARSNLFSILGDYVLKLKEMVATVRSLKTQIFTTLLIASTLIVFTLALVGVLSSVMPVGQTGGITGAQAGGLGPIMIQHLTHEQLEKIYEETVLALAISNMVIGLMIGKLLEGTMLRTRYAVLLYTVSLLVAKYVYVLAHAKLAGSFAIH